MKSEGYLYTYSQKADRNRANELQGSHRFCRHLGNDTVYYSSGCYLQDCMTQRSKEAVDVFNVVPYRCQEPPASFQASPDPCHN